ncbi:MAG: helix-turn-helix domain-containing protein [Lachnospiraceae bacterium]|nr:helix-turn-helix domain-containing protein [Lachnospiraceae bacterium]
MKALEDSKLFHSGRLVGQYGIVWNDDLDLEVETVYEEGKLVRVEEQRANAMLAYAVALARAQTGLTQKDLSQITGIDQSDISKIERGVANPSVNTLDRIATAMGCKLQISFISSNS